MLLIIKNTRFFCLLFICSFIFSCNQSHVKKVLTGVWVIDLNSMSYNNTLIGEDLSQDLIGFKENGIYQHPLIKFDNSFSNQEDEGSWELVEKRNELSIIVCCENKVFEGRYSVFFFLDSDNKYLNIMLISDKTSFICSKMFLSFKANKKIIEELCKLYPPPSGAEYIH